MLEVNDYTRISKPLLDHLDKKFPNGIGVSDISDRLGRQYVDLVQEGGGVHGVALAGYTYILEKMNITFMKMAGTSAGSINTLLLNAVNTKKEADLLGLKGSYYDTRSEKVLEYLANVDLKDFVDGPPLWRKLILGLFTPDFKNKGVKGILSRYKKILIFGGLAIALLVISGFLLAYDTGSTRNVWIWIFRLSFLLLAFAIIYVYLKIRYAGRLYRLVEKFGVNPGERFEQWLIEILRDNHIHSVADLTVKLEKEKEVLQPVYKACRPEADMKDSSVSLEEHEHLFREIENPKIKVENLYESLCEFYYVQQLWNESYKSAFWNRVIVAFEKRLAEDPVITKEIVIVSSDITHGLKVEFPGMHKLYWGNDTSISPARYVRASMSVPVFFRPMEVKFDGVQADNISMAWRQMLKLHNKLENHAIFVDGGLLSNFPINVFYSTAMPVPRKPTIGIKLEYENELDSRTINNFKEFGGSMLNTMRFFYDRDFALKQDLYKKTVRSIDTGKVHWLNFNLTDREKLELFFRGALAATIFLSSLVSDEDEIKELINLGSRLPLHDETFSIYDTDETKFQIEDLLIEDIGFEWQQYKIERLIDRLSKEPRKQEMKGGASLNI